MPISILCNKIHWSDFYDFFVRNTVDSIGKNLTFRQVKFDSFFCDKQKCLVGTKEGSFYTDSHHLSIFGSLKLKDKIRKSKVR